MFGIAASPGIAIGKAYLRLDPEIKIEKKTIDSTEVKNEIQRLHNALERVKLELTEIKKYIASELGNQKADIFKAHLMFLNDPELIPAIENKIKKENIRAETAVDEVINYYVELFSKMQNEYLKGRKIDIQDIGNRIIKELLGQEKKKKKLNEEVIIVAPDLTPADTAQLDRSLVKAFVTEQGSRTSHSAIMARSLGIPAVVGVGDQLLRNCNQGDLVVVDGNQGKVIINPEPETLKKYKNKASKYKKYQEKLNYYKDKKAVSKDNKRIEVVGNIGELEDIDAVIEQGGEGVGLFRTEFLYMNREQIPSEQEQFEVYRKVATKMKEKPVIIRTLDIGGGKDLPYLNLSEEKNPFLGYRAIRICLERTDLFKTQLKAILRASDFGNIKLMYPMISSLEELDAANRIFHEARMELDKEEIKYDKNIEVGIMIEIPATLLIAEELAREVDFFSIGTNDLIQYMLAVDRNNEKIADMHTPYHPAILRFIKRIIETGHKQGIWIGMCGEAAGDELLLPFLLGVGIDELSMSAVSILKIKHLLSKWTLKEAEKVAKKVLTLNNETEIKNLLNEVKGGVPHNKKR